MTSKSLKRMQRLMASGKCSRCGRRKLKTAWHCRACAKMHSEYQTAYAKNSAPKPGMLAKKAGGR